MVLYIDELKRRAIEIRNSTEYKEWKFAVLKRDGRRCVICGRKKLSAGIRLEVDHIQPFLLFPELMFDIDNGRTLCSVCHRKTPTYGNSSEHKRAHRATLHPFFKGDYLFKIKSMPVSMEFEQGKQSGFCLIYRSKVGKWRAGYGGSAFLPSWNTEGDSPEEAIDNMLVGLERMKTK